MKPHLRCISILLFLVALADRSIPSELPLFRMDGKDFDGGGAKQYGSIFFGVNWLNMVYARPTGDQSTMSASFMISQVPSEPMFLHLRARSSETGDCPIEIRVNDAVLLQGKGGFSSSNFDAKAFPIPEGALKIGKNVVTVSNLEEAGDSGKAPWFMLAYAAIAGKEYTPVNPMQGVTKGFSVRLPQEARPFPEPLAAGKEPSFKVRGTKGWNWTAQQYLEEIPTLAQGRMNFLMNCYLSLYTQNKHPDYKNEWWLPLSDTAKQDYEKVIKACQQHGIQFCFAMHPQLYAPRPLDPTSDEDFEKLWPHYAWAQSLGVKWFCLALDDVQMHAGLKINAAEHAQFVNKLIQRLRAKDPEVQFVFCPTMYWGNGTEANSKPYLQAIADHLDKDAYVFWTGPQVYSIRITRRSAEGYKNAIKHRIILWDNYPVNDGNPTLNLGPIVKRDADLCEVVDGYMSNPMATQSQINRLPLLTCADFAYNSKAYDPDRSIGQAILQMAKTDEQVHALKDLTEAYPGPFICGQNLSNFNPVRKTFSGLLSQTDAKSQMSEYIRRFEELSSRFGSAFPSQFEDARKTLDDDIAWMKQVLAKQK